MHIEIITECDGLFDHDAVVQTAQSICRRTDAVSVRSAVDGRSHSFHKGSSVVLIAVFHGKSCVERPHFSVQIRDEGVEGHATDASEGNGKKLYSTPSDLTDVLSTLVVTLLGYEATFLTGITVKDRNRCKVKPRIRILLPSLPFFRVEKELKLEKALTVTRDDSRPRSAEDTYQVCASDDKILLSLLSEYDLTFSGGINLYKVVCRDKQVLIVRKERVPQSFLVEVIYQKEALKRLDDVLERDVKGTQGIRDAILHPFNDEIDLEFYTELTRIAKERSSKTLDFLHDVVCMCPRLNDHRITYVKKIEDVFVKRTGRMERDLRKEAVETEYLSIGRERVVDRTPIGTLKAWYSRGRHVP